MPIGRYHCINVNWSFKQEEGETEDDESRNQNGGNDENDVVDMDDDDDKLTIDMKTDPSKVNGELNEDETTLSQK